MEIVKTTEINGLGAAIEEIKKREAEAQSKIQLFAKNFEEMTGYKPHQQINALDVVKIMFSIYGEPSK